MARSGLRYGLLAGSVLLGLWSSALAADFSDGQQRFTVGDYAGAAEIWGQLAENGDVRAQYSLATLLSQANNPLQDLGMAEKWARKAANQDYGPAKSLLHYIDKQIAAAPAQATSPAKTAAKKPAGKPAAMAAAPAPKPAAKPAHRQAHQQADNPPQHAAAPTPAPAAPARKAHAARQPSRDEPAMTAAPSDGKSPTTKQAELVAPKAAKSMPRASASASTSADPHAGIRDDVVAVIKALSARSARGDLKYGAITVDGSGPEYDVAIADVAFVGDSGDRFNIGTVKARIVEVDDRFRNVFVALPPHLPYHGQHGDGEIRIGSQDIAIHWDRQFATSTEFHLRLFDVAVADTAAKAPSVQFGELGIVSDVRPHGQRWDGPVAINIKRARLYRRDGGKLDLGDVALTATLHGFDLPRYLELASADGTLPMGSGDLKAEMSDMLSGLELTLTASDLSIDNPHTGHMQVDAVRQSLQFTGLDQPVANVRIEMAHDGLRRDGNDGAGTVADTLPRRLDLALNLGNVPLVPLVQAGFATGLEYALFGQIHSGEDVMANLTQALNDAHFAITVERANFATDKLDGNASGTLTADASAPGGMKGEIVLNVTGLSAALANHDSRETSGGANAGALTWLPLLASFGEPVDGGKVHQFRLSLLPGGQVAINGKPLSALLTLPAHAE